MTKRSPSLEKIKKLQKLNNLLQATKIPVPQIVVIGSQSSGKSSVLSSIMQMDILPCGSEMVTRCPIILNLHKNNANYTVIQKKRYVNEADIKSKIKEEMLKICAENTVTNEPVFVDIYGENLYDITMVDLPGLIKNPKKNQPENLEEEIENMVLNYIKQDNTFILAIINGCVDLANSASLKLSKKVDKDGVRTIGVITKLDLIDKGTNLVDLLNNKMYPLKHGYFGVINKTAEHLSFDEGSKNELEIFLKKNIEYKPVFHLIGYKVLCKSIFNIFVDLALKQHPSVVKYVYDQLNSLKNEEKKEFNTFEVISLYVDALTKLTDNSEYKNKNFAFKSMESFEMFFKKEFLKEFVNPEIKELIKKELIFTNSIFLSEKILKKFFRKLAQSFNDFVTKKIKIIFSNYLQLIENIEAKFIKDFPQQMKGFVIEKLNMQYKLLEKNLMEFYEIQINFINFDHPDFQPSKIFCNTFDSPKKESNWFSFEKPKIDLEFKFVNKFIETYFDIFKKSYIDYSQKCVWYYFISFVENKLLFLLSEKFSNFKDEEWSQSREKITAEIKSLQKAKDILDELISN